MTRRNPFDTNLTYFRGPLIYSLNMHEMFTGISWSQKFPVGTPPSLLVAKGNKDRISPPSFACVRIHFRLRGHPHVILVHSSHWSNRQDFVEFSTRASGSGESLKKNVLLVLQKLEWTCLVIPGIDGEVALLPRPAITFVVSGSRGYHLFSLIRCHRVVERFPWEPKDSSRGVSWKPSC